MRYGLRVGTLIVALKPKTPPISDDYFSKVLPSGRRRPLRSESGYKTASRGLHPTAVAQTAALSSKQYPDSTFVLSAHRRISIVRIVSLTHDISQSRLHIQLDSELHYLRTTKG